MPVNGRSMTDVADSICLEVLTDGKERAYLQDGPTPRTVDRALHDCAHAEKIMPRTSMWLQNELKEIAKDPSAQRPWGDVLKKLIVLAASNQVPRHLSGAEIVWRQLLKIPAYSETAMFVLAPQAVDRPELLGIWWDTVSNQELTKEEKKNHVYKFLHLGFRPSTPDAYNLFIKNLQRYGATWHIDLRMLVDEICVTLDVPPVFPPIPTSA